QPPDACCRGQARSAGGRDDFWSARLAVRGVRAAARAELLQLEAVRIIAPVLLGDVVPRLALRAGQCDLRPHINGLGHSRVLKSLSVLVVPVAGAGLEPATQRLCAA